MPILPWSDHRTRIDGAELERVVTEILRELGKDLPAFRIEQRERIEAPDGEYQIDVTLRFAQLGGAQFLVLVECKDHARPVEREDVQVLADKLRAIGAQKGILFSTNGFQRGALRYAQQHRIALVRIIDGALTYLTKSVPLDGVQRTPPSWANIPPFVGQLIRFVDEDSVRTTVVEIVERGRTLPLMRFVTGRSDD